jgi:Fic family protein
MLLGECRSKCEHIAGVPLPPDKAARMYAVYLAKGALATTAIEGNTLSEQEVLDHLEGKLKLPPSREYLAQEIDNIIAACNEILGEVSEKRTLNLSADRIRELNRIVLNNLTLDHGVTPGEIRQHEVTVARYRGAPAEDCYHLLERLCEWLAGTEFIPAAEHLILPIAILRAILAHVYLAWIHPFGDGNGRTARLVEFQILISSGVPAPAAHLLSNHYNQTRTEYYRQLENASRSGGDLVPFVDYALRGFVDGLKQQLDHVRQQQWDAAWRDHVQEAFDRRPDCDLTSNSQLAPVINSNRFWDQRPQPTRQRGGAGRACLSFFGWPLSAGLVLALHSLSDYFTWIKPTG